MAKACGRQRPEGRAGLCEAVEFQGGLEAVFCLECQETSPVINA